MHIRRTYTRRDFAWVGWRPSDLPHVVNGLLKAKRERYRTIKAIPDGKRTFENTVYAIEASHHGMWQAQAMALLMNVSPDQGLREAAKTALERLERGLVDIEYDAELYRAVGSYSRKRESLAPDEKKLLKDMLRHYRRMGFDLPPKKQLLLKRNLKRLSALGMRFTKNINDHTDHILISEEELAGLPEHYIAGLKRDTDGRYIVTLEYPDLHPFLENAESALWREELLRRALRQGGKKNLAIAAQMLKLRYANARLLGYADHVAYRLEMRMAKTPARASRFVRDLMQKVAKAVRKEMAELEAVKRKHTGDPKARLESHDIAYYGNLLKRQKFSVNNEVVREYFPLQVVQQGMFEIYETLFGVRFEPVSGIPLWHPDAELYVVKEAKTGACLAYFGMDRHPRPGKYGHAAAFNVISGHVSAYGSQTYVTPFACLVTNFPKARGKRLALLSHDEVETFFHEFGHILHEVLTEARFVSQSGFSVAWDFVEAPSQMFEHWVWTPKTLGRLSRHYQSGKRFPAPLLKSMLAAKNHLIAYWVMRQLIFSLYDLELHTGKPMSLSALLKRYHELVVAHVGVAPPKTALFLSGFGHFKEYDAGYYGYMWSKVYAVDMFSRFERAGLLSRAEGRRLRTWILSPGSSREEQNSLRGFLGRAPNMEAFLREIGIRKVRH